MMAFKTLWICNVYQLTLTSTLTHNYIELRWGKSSGELKMMQGNIVFAYVFEKHGVLSGFTWFGIHCVFCTLSQFYTATRYNDKFRFNHDLTGTKPSLKW